MLKMMEAFSKAREYCEVGLWVKASNLDSHSGQHPLCGPNEGKAVRLRAARKHTM